MSFTLALLLIHSAHVPARARSALRAALDSTDAERHEHLASAARILYAEAGLDCADARELVGLPYEGEGEGKEDCSCG